MLTNQQMKQLHKGILRTFNQRELEQLLSSKLGKGRYKTPVQSDYSDFALDVINDAEMQGWTADLLSTLHNEDPQEPIFRELIESRFPDRLTVAGKQEVQYKKESRTRRMRAVPALVGIITTLFIFMFFIRAQVPETIIVEQTVIVERNHNMSTPTPTVNSTAKPTISWESAMITHDFSEITLGGKAPYDASIRVLLDDEEIEDVEISKDDEWIVTTSVPPSGTYTIILELLEDEKVTKRFQRELIIPERP